MLTSDRNALDVSLGFTGSVWRLRDNCCCSWSLMASRSEAECPVESRMAKRSWLAQGIDNHNKPNIGKEEENRLAGSYLVSCFREHAGRS